MPKYFSTTASPLYLKCLHYLNFWEVWDFLEKLKYWTFKNTKCFTYMLWGFGLWLASPMELKYFVLGVKPSLQLACIQLMLHASKSWHLNGLFPSSEYFLTWRKNNTFHLKLASLPSFPPSPISRYHHIMYLQCCEEGGHLDIFWLRRITLKYPQPWGCMESCREFLKPFTILGWIGVTEREL